MGALRKSLFIFFLTFIVIFLAFPPILELKRKSRISAALHQIQASLQDYHVDQERYVPSLNMRGAELISILSESGFFNDSIINPYTGKMYSPNEPEESDRILYRSDEQFETYALQALHFHSDEVWLEIDSVANHSLE